MKRCVTMMLAVLFLLAVVCALQAEEKSKLSKNEQANMPDAQQNAVQKLRLKRVLVITEPPEYHVTSINFCGQKGDDDLLEQLENLPDLQSLNVNGCQIKGDQLKHFAKLTSLASLVLSENQVTDKGLAELRGLTNLESLHLRDTPVSDAGLEHLAAIPSIKVLDLSKTKVTDEGLKKLATLTNLKWLLLAETDVSDAGMESLAAIGSLGRVTVNKTKVTEEGVKKLKQALPRVQVDIEKEQGS
jgi:hypothetical protein